MLWKIVRLVLVLLSLGLLAYGLFGERHRVGSFAGDEPREVSGPEFTEYATSDGLMLKDGELFDATTGIETDEGGAPAGCAT